MRLATWTLSAALLLANMVAAKAVSIPSRVVRGSSSYEEMMGRAVADYENRVERRSPVGSASPSISSTAPQINTTVEAACEGAVAMIKTVNNSAGYAGCYNILAWDPKSMLFQADLRMYQPQKPVAEWANIPPAQVKVHLMYPNTTIFRSMVKRSVVDLETRDGQPTQMVHYNLAGSFMQPIDLSKLNNTLLASLMIPTISLQATDTTTKKSMTSNMSVSDSAWFVSGQFTEMAPVAAQVANPSTVSAAMAATKSFVLPGTSLGIFPVGLIVTSVWTLFFLSAFGLGTISRLRSRDIFRKRVLRMTAHGQR